MQANNALRAGCSVARYGFTRAAAGLYSALRGKIDAADNGVQAGHRRLARDRGARSRAVHAGFSALGGGFVGVDVFFVISGFLITKLIVDDPRFSLLAFYQRRARRILPALAVVVLATSVAAYIFFLPEEFLAFSKSVVATTLFSSNILFWQETGYFDAPRDLKPLLHTWSLAVEEQFRTGASSSWKMSGRP